MKICTITFVEYYAIYFALILKFSIFVVCLRLQVNPQNKTDFVGISPERAFADFIFAHVILHLVVINFIG